MLDHRFPSVTSLFIVVVSMALTLRPSVNCVAHADSVLPNVTQTAAIEIAKTFCAKIGRTVPTRITSELVYDADNENVLGGQMRGLDPRPDQPQDMTMPEELLQFDPYSLKG